MIVVRIIGGLGNQMFQYATARAAADRLGVELLLDLRGMSTYRVSPYRLDRFAIRARPALPSEVRRWPKWARLGARLSPRVAAGLGMLSETQLTFNPKVERLGDNMLLDGYFQSERYFSAIAPALRREFVPREQLSAAAQALAISAEAPDSVMIHVRRGDYVHNHKARAVHGLCSMAYYESAMTAIKAKVPNPRFFIFSDDLAWTRQNLHVTGDSIWVSGNPAEVDLYLMSKCHHHIIANSTFSWWGAWLGEKPGSFIVAPTPWFEHQTVAAPDLIPFRWHPVAK